MTKKAGFNRETSEIRENAPFHHSSFSIPLPSASGAVYL
jgi:hypothetical protein